MDITKRTYDLYVKKFAVEALTLFNDLRKFNEEAKLFKSQFDTLCDLIDRYTNLNNRMSDYSHKHKINLSDFHCDVNNLNWEKLN